MKKTYIYGSVGTIISLMLIKSTIDRERKILNMNKELQVPEFLKPEPSIDEVVNSTTKTVSSRDREALIASIHGMNDEELEVILDNIPTHLVMNRISKELNRAKKFEEAVRAAIPE